MFSASPESSTLDVFTTENAWFSRAEKQNSAIGRGQTPAAWPKQNSAAGQKLARGPAAFRRMGQLRRVRQ